MIGSLDLELDLVPFMISELGLSRISASLDVYGLTDICLGGLVVSVCLGLSGES
jgi:hypothetical protein